MKGGHCCCGSSWIILGSWLNYGCQNRIGGGCSGMCWWKWIHRSYYTWWWMEWSNFWLIIPEGIWVTNSGGSVSWWRIAIWHRWMICVIFRCIKGGDDSSGRLMWMMRRRDNLCGKMWMMWRRENLQGRWIGFISGGTWWCIDRFRNWRWIEHCKPKTPVVPPYTRERTECKGGLREIWRV